MEIWKSVEGYNGLYMVSSLGRIKSMYDKGNKILKDRFDGKGKYKQACLYCNGQAKYHLLHRLVAKAFIQEIPGKDIVNHINGIKTDNRVANLEWVTQSENHKHAWDTGLKTNSDKKRTATIKSNIENKSKIVFDSQTGIYYASLTEAAKTFNMPVSSLGRKLIGDLKNNTSLRYVF